MLLVFCTCETSHIWGVLRGRSFDAALLRMNALIQPMIAVLGSATLCGGLSTSRTCMRGALRMCVNTVLHSPVCMYSCNLLL
jgi:hypothetical protein